MFQSVMLSICKDKFLINLCLRLISYSQDFDSAPITTNKSIHSKLIFLIAPSTDEEDKRRRNAVARFQWHLAYTLLNNSSVRLLRKGYMQAEEKAKGKRFTQLYKILNFKMKEPTKITCYTMAPTESAKG